MPVTGQATGKREEYEILPVSCEVVCQALAAEGAGRSRQWVFASETSGSGALLDDRICREPGVHNISISAALPPPILLWQRHKKGGAL